MAAKTKEIPAEKVASKIAKNPCDHAQASIIKTTNTWQRLWCPTCHMSYTRKIKLVTTEENAAQAA